MAKTYGGGAGAGRSSPSKTVSVIGNAAPINVRNEYHRSSRRYSYTVLEASDAGNGVLELDYARGKPTQVNRNTTVYDITLRAGIYNQMGSRTLRSHNIDWQAVKEVRGQTFGVGDLLKQYGFVWNPNTRSWVKK